LWKKSPHRLVSRRRALDGVEDDLELARLLADV